MMTRICAGLALVAGLFPSGGLAEDLPSLPDRLWDVPTLFDDQDDPVLQRLALTGLVQYQYAIAEAGEDDVADGEFRRFRFGGKAQVLGNLYFSGAANFEPEGGEFYDNLSTSYLAWSPFGNSKKALSRFQIAAGKMKPRFTREYSTAAKKIKTFERSLLVNQLAPAKATGILIGGEVGSLSYVLSLYSGDDTDEFSRFENGTLFLGKLGWDIREHLNLGIDYLAGSDDQQITAPVDHAVSLSASYNETYEAGKLALVTDFIVSLTQDDSDAFGIVLLPTYQLGEKWELVGRYQYAASSGDDGLVLQKRYERQALFASSPTRGEGYHAGYLGLNYFLHGNQLKLMTGVEYARMSNARFDGWTWFSGLRMDF
tara:strand:+ start:10296 stop:11408 length:1113 start_codon:yes stop_codon:yes gene_type:complete